MTLPRKPFHSGSNSLYATTRLNIYLDAIIANWRILDNLNANAETSAVVKANAYGLGAEVIAQALFDAGCRSFFVALPEEGAILRSALNECPKGSLAKIYILNGPFSGKESAEIFQDYKLIPVINSLQQASIWMEILKSSDTFQPSALHVDTGMNRLGLRLDEFISLINSPDIATLNPHLLMSHLACASTPDHPLNAKQLEAFQTACAAYPGARKSLSNSAGHFLSSDFHFDMTRPGIALYGGQCSALEKNPMNVVATLESRIIQMRTAKSGEIFGYGAAHKFEKDTKIAILGTGYADGFHRSASGSKVPLRETNSTGAMVSIAGYSAPVIGRVSMDMIAVDIDHIPDQILEKTHWAELFGHNVALDDLAQSCGTIGYEILTSLSDRSAITYQPVSEN